MRPSVRLLACLALLAVVAGAVGCPHALEFFRTARGDSDLSGALGHLQAEHRRSDDLDSRLADSYRRRALKEEIAAAVAAGRLRLPEAAARFRAMDEQLPGFSWKLFRDVIPGSSDEERHCRVVISYVGSALAARPAEAAEVVAALKAELRGHLERDGTVYFPEADPPEQ